MKKFTEERVTPSILKHMTHSEDLIFFGKKGCDLVLNTFRDIFEALKGNSFKSKVTLKLDGSPAIVAASDFHGETFVALKHSWEKGNRFHTCEEIDQVFSGSSNKEEKAAVALKLKILLKYLPYIEIPKDEAWMGDVLFSKEDLRKENLDGEDCIIFQPNTIVYAIPESDITAKVIKRAELGIAWHTKYTGTFENPSLSFDVDVSRVQQIPQVYQIDAHLPNLSGIVTMTEDETSKAKEQLARIENDLTELQNTSAYQTVISDEKLAEIVREYSNAMIRKGTQDYEAETFLSWFSDRCDIMMKAKKTERGKLNVLARKTRVNELLKDIQVLFQVQRDIALLKEFYINKLNKLNKLKSYILHSQNGYLPTSGEGFAVSDINGNVQKLVSRLEFSRNNFSPDIIKGWSNERRLSSIKESRYKEMKKEKIRLDKRFPDLKKAVEDKLLKSDLDIKKINSGPSYKNSAEGYNLNLNVMPSESRGGSREQAIEDFISDVENDDDIHVTTYRVGTTPVANVKLNIGGEKRANITLKFKDIPGISTNDQEEMWAQFIYDALEEKEFPSDEELKNNGYHSSWRRTFLAGAKKAVEFLGKKKYIISRENTTFPEKERSTFNDIDAFYKKHKSDIFKDASDKNSWNPSDLYACEKGFEVEFAYTLNSLKNLSEVNEYLKECILNRKVIGISLKELSGSSAKLECVNFNENDFESAGGEAFALSSFDRKKSTTGNAQFNIPALSPKDKDMSGLKFLISSKEGTVAKFDYRNFTGGPGAGGFQFEGIPIPAKARWSKVPITVVNSLYDRYGIPQPGSCKEIIKESWDLDSLTPFVEEILKANFSIKTLNGTDLNLRNWNNYVSLIKRAPDGVKGTSIWIDDSHGSLFQWGRVLRMLLLFARAKQEGSIDSVISTIVNSCQKIGNNFAPFIKIF